MLQCLQEVTSAWILLLEGTRNKSFNKAEGGRKWSHTSLFCGFCCQNHAPHDHAPRLAFPDFSKGRTVLWQKMARLVPLFWLVYFLSSLRARSAKTVIYTKSGVSADSRKSAQKCETSLPARRPRIAIRRPLAQRIRPNATSVQMTISCNVQWGAG